MYNGIGLTTARGSGTNGFVQRNLSLVPTKQKRVEYKTEDELKRLDSEMSRGPNLEILKHARKRQIELKCLEMRELMEEQNYTEEDIEEKVSKFRKMLFEKDAELEGTKVVLEKDEFGRPLARDSHEIAQAQAEKNRRFKEALGLPSDYIDGSSLEKLGKQNEPKPEPKYGFIDEPEGEKDIPTTSVAAPVQVDKLRTEDSASRQSESDSEVKSRNKKEKRHKKKKSRSDRHDSDSEREEEEEDEGHHSRSRSSSPKRRHHHRHEDRHGKHSKRREEKSRSRSGSRSSDKKRSSKHRRRDDSD